MNHSWILSVSSVQDLKSLRLRERSSVNVTSASAKRSECVREIAVTTSQDQRRKCRRPPANKFHTDTFLVIIDRIDAELRKRLGAYTGIAARFGFLRKLKDLSVEEVVESAKILQEAYPTDLEASLSDELVQFSGFLRTDFAMKSLDVTTASATSSPAMNDTSCDESDDEDDLTKDDNDVTLNVDSLELRMYRLLLENNLETVFPNTVIALRIYLSLMISNCSGERSFSKLKLIKNQLRSCPYMTNASLGFGFFLCRDLRK